MQKANRILICKSCRYTGTFHFGWLQEL